MAKMTKDQKDEQVEKLLAIVAKQKAEIARAERPKWETNCSFGTNEDSSSRTNLQTVTDADQLVKLYAFLLREADYYERAAAELGQTGTFKWQGFTLEAWQSDFKTRINKIQIAKMKAKLEASEKALGGLISQEKREEMELERITKELGV